MGLVDNEGKPLKKSMSQGEVLSRLESILPKNPEQRKIFIQKFSQQVEKNRQARMNHGLETGFNGVFEDNYKERIKSDGYSDSRNYRHIASIPRDMLYVAQQIWGDDVLTNKVKFKKAFKEDETGRMCLTVDPKTI